MRLTRVSAGSRIRTRIPRATQALFDHTQITVCTLHPTLREAKQRQTQGPRGRNAYIFSRVTRSGASPFQQHLQWLSKLARRPS